MSADRITRLLALVKKTCSVRGRKAALARACGVELNQVSRWLGGRARPSAESYAAILDWLEQADPVAFAKYHRKPIALTKTP